MSKKSKIKMQGVEISLLVLVILLALVIISLVAVYFLVIKPKRDEQETDNKEAEPIKP